MMKRFGFRRVGGGSGTDAKATDTYMDKSDRSKTRKDFSRKPGAGTGLKLGLFRRNKAGAMRLLSNDHETSSPSVSPTKKHSLSSPLSASSSTSSSSPSGPVALTESDVSSSTGNSSFVANHRERVNITVSKPTMTKGSIGYSKTVLAADVSPSSRNGDDKFPYTPVEDDCSRSDGEGIVMVRRKHIDAKSPSVAQKSIQHQTTKEQILTPSVAGTETSQRGPSETSQVPFDEPVKSRDAGVLPAQHKNGGFDRISSGEISMMHTAPTVGTTISLSAGLSPASYLQSSKNDAYGKKKSIFDGVDAAFVWDEEEDDDDEDDEDDLEDIYEGLLDDKDDDTGSSIFTGTTGTTGTGTMGTGLTGSSGSVSHSTNTGYTSTTGGSYLPSLGGTTETDVSSVHRSNHPVVALSPISESGVSTNSYNRFSTARSTGNTTTTSSSTTTTRSTCRKNTSSGSFWSDMQVALNDFIIDGKACVGCVADTAHETVCQTPDSSVSSRKTFDS